MINKVTLLGRLARDPESRNFANGGMVCNLRVLTSRNWKDRNSGERVDARHGGWFAANSSIAPGTAFLFLAAGLRIAVARRLYVVGPALTGAILGTSLVSLLGYAIGALNFHYGLDLTRTSPLTATGFAVLSAMFLWTDTVYAAQEGRTRILPLAVGIVALVAMVSLRITQGTIEHLAAMAPRDGAAHVIWDFGLLIVSNALVSILLALAVLLFLASRRQVEIARQEIARREQANADMTRTTARLNRAYAELEQVLDILGRDLRMSVDTLREQAQHLQVHADTGDLPNVHRAVIEIAEGARLLSNRLAELSRFADFESGDVVRADIDFGRMVRETLFMNRAMIQGQVAAVDAKRAEGRLFADRTLIQQALNLILTEALLASGQTPRPKITIELRRTLHESTIAVRAAGIPASKGRERERERSMDIDEGDGESRNLALVRRIARSHDGTFLVSPSSGAARDYLLIIPDPDDADPSGPDYIAPDAVTRLDRRGPASSTNGPGKSGPHAGPAASGSSTSGRQVETTSPARQCG